MSIRFSFSNGLLCVRFWNFDEEEWHGNLRDNVIQSENKISEKKQPWAQGKKLFHCFFYYSNTCKVYLPVVTWLSYLADSGDSNLIISQFWYFSNLFASHQFAYQIILDFLCNIIIYTQTCRNWLGLLFEWFFNWQTNTLIIYM